LTQRTGVMNAADPGRTDEELMAGTAGDIADEALEAAAGTADAQVGTWVNCTPIWWCPGASARPADAHTAPNCA